jgi:hypothetical protein
VQTEQLHLPHEMGFDSHHEAGATTLLAEITHTLQGRETSPQDFNESHDLKRSGADA